MQIKITSENHSDYNKGFSKCHTQDDCDCNTCTITLRKFTTGTISDVLQFVTIHVVLAITSPSFLPSSPISQQNTSKDTKYIL